MNPIFMDEALKEAARGLGRTAPNPPVGAVVVKDGRIVGRGYHKGPGHPHAEVMALQQAGDEARGADIYVTLEPCNHYGRTPPCTLAIEGAGISRVFVATRDPNPVAAGGLEYLRTRGILIRSEIHESRSRALLEPFLTRVMLGRPLMVLKGAMTLDGIGASQPGEERLLITGPEASLAVHHLRDMHDAIMVGGRTAELDDPLLTCRIPGGRNPVRIVVDPSLEHVSPDLRMFHEPGDTYVIHGNTKKSNKIKMLQYIGAKLITLDPSLPPGQAIVHAAASIEGVDSILVEGGPTLARLLLKEGLVDRVLAFVSPDIAGKGIPYFKDVSLSLEHVSHLSFGRDVLIAGRPSSRISRVVDGPVITPELEAILRMPASHAS